jgi:hypothetical protein
LPSDSDQVQALPVGSTRTTSRTGRRIAVIGARLVIGFAALGVFVSFIGRGGGGGHSCPAGSRPSDCSYPWGPWRWEEGIVIGAIVGLLVFLAWLAVQKISRD